MLKSVDISLHNRCVHEAREKTFDYNAYIFIHEFCNAAYVRVLPVSQMMVIKRL